MTAEQIERNRAFLADLRANPKKATCEMLDLDGGRCCLCVAYDTAQRLGAGLQAVKLEEEGLPPCGIEIFYGWPSKNPELRYEGRRATASAMNDGVCFKELTHAQIADAFEETFPELKQP
jgi:hypothetical protein